MHDHDGSQAGTLEIEQYLLSLTCGLLELAADKGWPVITFDEEL